MKTYKYSILERWMRTLYRKFKPVPVSPWTHGDTEDKCSINLVPSDTLIGFFEHCLDLLYRMKGSNVGDYLEFGVFNGSSIRAMYRARQTMHMLSMRLFGFDSFQGLPKEAEGQDCGVWQEGFYKCSRQETEQCLRRRGVPKGAVTLIEGWFNRTLTDELVCTYELVNPGVIFIDCDVYESAKTVLDFLAPLITDPCIICLDDWKLNSLDIRGQGEYRAFNEFINTNPHLRAEKIRSYNRKSRSYLITVE